MEETVDISASLQVPNNFVFLYTRPAMTLISVTFGIAKID